MPRSILEAIKQGDWEFEPISEEPVSLNPTTALPGTAEKLLVLAQRLEQGLPLWHPADPLSYEDRDKPRSRSW